VANKYTNGCPTNRDTITNEYADSYSNEKHANGCSSNRNAIANKYTNGRSTNRHPRSFRLYRHLYAQPQWRAERFLP
ncbi:MAG: hypothetical protein AAF614_00460, partial [Chloroflexota bacterium]